MLHSQLGGVWWQTGMLVVRVDQQFGGGGRRVLGVDAARVIGQRVRMAEAVVAARAPVAPLAAVHAQVLVEVPGLAERLVADVAAERPLARVAAAVRQQVARRPERAEADAALEPRRAGLDRAGGCGGGGGVDAPLVLPQRARVDEALVARRAAARLVAGVDAHVQLEARRLAERLVADAAAVRPLAAVRARVPRQVARRREHLRADAALQPETGVPPLRRVAVHADPVLPQRTRVDETLLARRALVRPVARVDPGVSGQVAGSREHLAADGTLGPVASGALRPVAVHAVLVLLQRERVSEAPAAGRAAEGFLVRVDAHVHLQDGRLRERLVAEVAPVRTVPGVLSAVSVEVRLRAA